MSPLFESEIIDKWGFLASLLNAQDFDYIQSGTLDLAKIHPDISTTSMDRLWTAHCDLIMVGSKTLRQYYEDNVKKLAT